MSDPGFKRFQMVDDQVQEIPNTLLQLPNVEEIISVESVPSWVLEFNMGDSFNLRIQFRVAVCRPFLIFIRPIYQDDNRLRVLNSPSPPYDLG